MAGWKIDVADKKQAAQTDANKLTADASLCDSYVTGLSVILVLFFFQLSGSGGGDRLLVTGHS